MLVAALLVFLSVGSGASPMVNPLDEMASRAKTIEIEEVIRKDILNIISKMQDTTKQYMKTDNERNKKVVHYLETEDQADKALQQQLDINYQRRAEYQNEMLTLRFELKNAVNESQWNALMDTATGK